eukprot:3941970-Rhodomonas_salina.6
MIGHVTCKGGVGGFDDAEREVVLAAESQHRGGDRYRDLRAREDSQRQYKHTGGRAQVKSNGLNHSAGTNGTEAAVFSHLISQQ